MPTRRPRNVARASPSSSSSRRVGTQRRAHRFTRRRNRIADRRPPHSARPRTRSHTGDEKLRSLTSLAASSAAKPVGALGEFFSMSLDTFVLMFRRPFAWREFLLQTWFVARVALVPTVMLAIPFTVMVVFVINTLLVEIGAADFSGSGAALGSVTQIGPIVTVLVISGAGATAMCADLGARTIREELDALRVLGINPVHSLVVPRVLAATVVAAALVSLVTIVGIIGGFVFSVFVQHVTPGAFASGLTLLTGLPEVVLAVGKGALF